MKKIISLAIIGLLALAPTLVNAQDGNGAKKSKIERKKQMKEKFENMPPEQKAKMLANRKAAKEKYNSMTPAEQQAAKDKFKEKRKKRKADKV